MGIFDRFKAFFKQGSGDMPAFDFSWCPNCSHQIKMTDKICNKCGHKQGTPIIKKKTNVLGVVEAFSIPFYNQEFMSNLMKRHREIANEFGIKEGEPNFTPIINELLTMRIAIQYLLTLYHYENIPKFAELKSGLDKSLTQLAVDLWGQDYSDNTFSILSKRILQFQKPLCEDDAPTGLAKLIQHIIELHILFSDNEETLDKALNSDYLDQSAKMWAMPSIYHLMLCHGEVVSLIMVYKTYLNRWEIE